MLQVSNLAYIEITLRKGLVVIAFVLTVITLAVLLGVVGLFLWLLWKASALWKNGQKEAALACWAIASMMVVVPAWGIISNQQEQARRLQAVAISREVYEAEVKQAEHNLANLVTVVVLAQSIPDTTLGCQFNCNWLYAQYRVTNNSPLTVEVTSTINQAGHHCSSGRWGEVLDTVGPRQAITTYCTEATRSSRTATPRCVNIRYSNYPNSRQVICG